MAVSFANNDGNMYDTFDGIDKLNWYQCKRKKKVPIYHNTFKNSIHNTLMQPEKQEMWFMCVGTEML